MDVITSTFAVLILITTAKIILLKPTDEEVTFPSKTFQWLHFSIEIKSSKWSIRVYKIHPFLYLLFTHLLMLHPPPWLPVP